MEGLESGQSVVAAFSQAMGEYYQPDDDQPASPAPEAPVAETTEPKDAAPETPAERTAEPAADAPETAPDVPPTEPSEYAALLSAGRVASYKVDGQEKAYDKIKIVDGDVGIIDTADLPEVLKHLGERDHWFESDRQKYAAIQQYERLAEWKRTGEDGKEQTFSGQQGLAEMRLDYARVLTERDLYESIFKDPEALFSILMQQGEGPDAKIIHNPERLEALQLRAALLTDRAQSEVRKDFMVRAQAPAPTFDTTTVAQYAPALITQAAGADDAILTPELRATLTQHMKQYVRDVRQGETGHLGKIIDASFGDLVRSFVAQAKAAKVTVTANTDADKANAARVAAALRGVPKKNAPPPKKPVQPPKNTDSDDAWDLHERAASRALRAGRA